jgi:hypothetical protein
MRRPEPTAPAGLAGQVRIARHANPADPRVLTIQVNLDVNQPASARVPEAADLLDARLRLQLNHLSRHPRGNHGHAGSRPSISDASDRISLPWQAFPLNQDTGRGRRYALVTPAP